MDVHENALKGVLLWSIFRIMAELTINTLIKIILGIVVVIAVVTGLYLGFKNSILDFFKNIFSSVG